LSRPDEPDRPAAADLAVGPVECRAGEIRKRDLNSIRLRR
jgi:hypothetical protein